MSGIAIDSIQQIRDYLLYHPDMIESVLSISKQCRESFGRDAQLILTYEIDPEVNHDSLVLWVRKVSYSSDFFDRVDDVIQRNQHLLSNRSGWITVTTDFNPPIL